MSSFDVIVARVLEINLFIWANLKQQIRHAHFIKLVMVGKRSKFGFCGVVCRNVVSSKYNFLPNLFVTVSKGEYTCDNYYIMMNIKGIVFWGSLFKSSRFTRRSSYTPDLSRHIEFSRTIQDGTRITVDSFNEELRVHGKHTYIFFLAFQIIYRIWINQVFLQWL